MRDGDPMFWQMNRGEWHPAAKLTDDDVKLIRALKGERDKAPKNGGTDSKAC